MHARHPNPSDFPPSINITIIPPPQAASQPTNILVLLHGLGDTAGSFTTLGKNLALPETSCISLQAPTPLPFQLGGWHWGDDIAFDQATGEIECDTGFEKAGKVIKNIVQDALMSKCGYTPRKIFFFGFGQGGMVAIAAVLGMAELGEFGGIISIGGPVPTPLLSARSASKTPICVLGGSSNTLVTRYAVANIKRCFTDIVYQKFERAGDDMPRTREEMYPIMRFLAWRMQSRRGVPEEALEVG